MDSFSSYIWAQTQCTYLFFDSTTPDDGQKTLKHTIIILLQVGGHPVAVDLTLTQTSK
jgi:hypothetical protein